MCCSCPYWPCCLFHGWLRDHISLPPNLTITTSSLERGSLTSCGWPSWMKLDRYKNLRLAKCYDSTDGADFSPKEKVSNYLEVFFSSSYFPKLISFSTVYLPESIESQSFLLKFRTFQPRKSSWRIWNWKGRPQTSTSPLWQMPLVQILMMKFVFEKPLQDLNMKLRLLSRFCFASKIGGFVWIEGTCFLGPWLVVAFCCIPRVMSSEHSRTTCCCNLWLVDLLNSKLAACCGYVAWSRKLTANQWRYMKPTKIIRKKMGRFSMMRCGERWSSKSRLTWSSKWPVFRGSNWAYMFVAQVGFSEQSEVYTATGGPNNLGENALIPWGISQSSSSNGCTQEASKIKSLSMGGCPKISPQLIQDAFENPLAHHPSRSNICLRNCGLCK